MTKIAMALQILALGLTCTPAVRAATRVDILEASVLKSLDQPGEYSFATLLGVDDSDTRLNSDSKLWQLRVDELNRRSPLKFQKISSLIVSDINEVVQLSGERMAYSSEIAETMAVEGKVPRFFDPFWLSSSKAALPLVAVVNRVDRRDFSSNSCGEVRFIYRMAYLQTEPVESQSSLPLFLNVVFEYPKQGNCQQVARAWQNLPVASAQGGLSLIDQLKIFAINKKYIKLKQIELNMQAIRYPSELKFDFGGQAVYLLRIFQEQNGVYQSIPLENNINVGEILQSPKLKQSLLEQLSRPENLRKIDAGTFVLSNTDGKLLSSRALSFTTIGRARVANKPFTALFGVEANDLKNINLSDLRFIKTPRAMVERLNGLTCVGCHQTGGTAGFHMLGRTNAFNNVFNQVLLPFSAHYGAERIRRKQYGELLANGQEPSTFRPPSFFPPIRQLGTDKTKLPEFREAKTRDLCLKADQISYGRGIVCETGSSCIPTATNSQASITIGECVANKNVVPGSVCRKGQITSHPPTPALGEFYNLFAIRDTMTFDTVLDVPNGRCTKPREGVPLGRIPRTCKADSAEGRLEFVDALKTADDAPRSFCVVQGGDAFDNCAKSANPSACLAQAEIARAYLDTCTPSRFCREDYICQRLPNIGRQYNGRTRELVEQRVTRLEQLGVGFCVPNYFIFNMRADGHILPEGRVKAIQ